MGKDSLKEFAKVKALEAEIARLQKKETTGEVASIKAKVLALAKRKAESGSWTLLELARKVNARPDELEAALDQLHIEGHDISVEEGQVKHLAVAPAGRLATHTWRLKEGGWLRFGVLGDTQLGNRKARLDVLGTAYEHYAKEGIDTVYHTGNLIDGFALRINAFELLEEAGVSLESQSAYAARVYPRTPGITTYFITGECHEGWMQKSIGVNVGRVMEDRFKLPLACREKEFSKSEKDRYGSPRMLGEACRATMKDGFCSKHGRKDLIYLGYEEADIELRTSKLPEKTRGPIVRLLHPGGGTAYALSYKTQKLAESLQGGEKPDIQLVGHFHKYDANFHREVFNLTTGCLQDQTTFMRKLMLAAHVGYLILECFVAQDGTITRFRHEWVPFFDQGFYKKFEK